MREISRRHAADHLAIATELVVDPGVPVGQQDIALRTGIDEVLDFRHAHQTGSQVHESGDLESDVVAQCRPGTQQCDEFVMSEQLFGVALDEPRTPLEGVHAQARFRRGRHEAIRRGAHATVPGDGFEPSIHGFTDRCLRPAWLPWDIFKYMGLVVSHSLPRSLTCTLKAMSREDIDRYLAALDQPKRATLEHLRETILRILPEAEQCLSYRVPAFRVEGQVIAGFAAFKDHLSYLPFSGSVLSQMPEDVAGYAGTKSALHFPVDRPLPKSLVEKLIEVRGREIAERQGEPPQKTDS